jgi:hypothetical protein
VGAIGKPKLQNVRDTIDALTVKAKFTHDDIKVSATLRFNEKGEFVD